MSTGHIFAVVHHLTDLVSIGPGPLVNFPTVQIDEAQRSCAGRPFGLGGMPDRSINTPCDGCLDEDGCPKRGWTPKELEAVRRSHSQSSTFVVIRQVAAAPNAFDAKFGFRAAVRRLPSSRRHGGNCFVIHAILPLPATAIARLRLQPPHLQVSTST